MKKIVLVDLDGVMVDFKSGIDQLTVEEQNEYQGREDEFPGIFSLMHPKKDAIESYQWLSHHFDTYILSTAPWENPSAWSDKLEWVKKYLSEYAHKKLILSHHKNLVMGDYLIDDRNARGVDKFGGKHLHFGQNYETGELHEYPDWASIRDYFSELI